VILPPLWVSVPGYPFEPFPDGLHSGQIDHVLVCPAPKHGLLGTMRGLSTFRQPAPQHCLSRDLDLATLDQELTDVFLDNFSVA